MEKKLGFKISNSELDKIDNDLIQEVINTKEDFNKNNFENLCFNKLFDDSNKEKEILIRGVNLNKMSTIDLAYFLNRDVASNQVKEQVLNQDLKFTPNKEEITLKLNNDSFIEDKEETNYCICNKKVMPYQGNMMISCDGKCKNWYHYYCIKLTKIEQNIIDFNDNIYWLCNKCLYEK